MESIQPLRLRNLSSTKERRQLRSPDSSDALRLALSSSAYRGELDAVLVTDDYGMIVAKNATDMALDMLAAVTPIVARGKAKANIKQGGNPKELSVKSVRILGEVLHVAALGGQSDRREAEIRRSLAATKRILG